MSLQDSLPITSQVAQCVALSFSCKNSSMCALFRRFHQLNEYATQILGEDKYNRRPVRPDARFTQYFRALGFHLCLGDMNIGHFKTNMMLSALRVLLDRKSTRLNSSH